LFSIFFEKNIELTKEEIEKEIQVKINNLKEIEKEGKGADYIRELSDLAFLQLEIEQFHNAEENFQIALKYFRNIRDRLGQAAVLGVLGTLYFKTNEYKKSINYYQEALEIYEELSQIQEQITCLMGIGNNFLKLEELDEACDIFLECSSLCSDNSDIYGLLDCLGNLISIHEALEKWDVVYELYKKTLEAFQKLKDQKGIIISYFNLGILEKKNNNLEDALIFFKQGTNQAIDSNYAELIIKGLGYVGETLFYLGKVREAKNEFIRALKLARKIKAENAIIQLKILLNSLGLSDNEIENELNSS